MKHTLDVINANNDQPKTDFVDESFDVFLREKFSSETVYIDDEQFSRRVMESLPPARKLTRLQEWLIILIPVITVGSSVLFVGSFSLLSFAIKAWVFLTLLSAIGIFKIVFVMSILTLLGIGVWFAKYSRLL